MKKITLLCTAIIYCSIIATFAQTPFATKMKTKNGTVNLNNPVKNINNIASIKNVRQVVNYTYKTAQFPILGNNFYNPVRNSKGQLIFIQGSLTKKTFLNVNDNQCVKIVAYEYLDALKQQLCINKPSDEFELENINTDKLGITHIKMQQTYKNIPVYGSEIILHAKDGAINLFNGSFYPTPKLESIIPSITNNQAIEIAIQNVKTLTSYKELNANQKTILNYDIPKTELVIYHLKHNLETEYLVYHITLRPNFVERWEYFVDANSGKIIHKFNNTQYDGSQTATGVDLNGVTRTINTYLYSGTYYMVNTTKGMFNSNQSVFPDKPIGAIMSLNAHNTYFSNITQFTSLNNTWVDASSISSHYNASIIYDYYKAVHNRTSYNNQGNTIMSFVNVSEQDGSSMENAFWNGEFIAYGNGGSTFKPLAGSLDVAAHEFGHAVIGTSANLEYQDQSGAINETFADISGAMLDRNDWQIGEDIMQLNTPNYPTGSLRDMSNPHNGGNNGDPCWQPANVSEMYNGTDDNGGVHINSGIGNYAFYLYATATTKEKAEQVFFRALFNYLTKSSQFIDLRLSVIQSAKDLYGDNSSEVLAAASAFDQVGITDGNTTQPSDLTINPGNDYLLLYSVASEDPNSLYVATTNISTATPLTSTVPYSCPSVTDDGSVAVFISQDHKIRAITLDSTMTEIIIQNDPIWDNVAVSKDGSKIAAISSYIDSAIYVYDFSLETWKKFHLFNPTTQNGVVTQNVLYAGSMEWDYSGEFIIYDSYNKINNSSSQAIDYWDIGVINIWNNTSNTWGNGGILKFFSGLPEGVNLGNPTLSKNSPYIGAFDYFDSNTNTSKIIAMNFETNDLGDVYTNNGLSYPNYSKLDDKIIFTKVETDNSVSIATIGLQTNKILPVSNSLTTLVNNAKWSIWFSQGIRPLTGIDNLIMDNEINIYPNPTSGIINFDLTDKSLITIFDISGKNIYQNYFNVTGKNSVNLIEKSKGLYFINIRSKDKNITKKIMIE